MELSLLEKNLIQVILSLHFNATFLLEEYKKLGGFPNPTPPHPSFGKEMFSLWKSVI